MKTTVTGLGLAALMACGLSAAEGITEQQSWQRSYPVAAAPAKLLVRNIWGNVTVRPGASREIVVSVHEHRTAPTREQLEYSKEHLRLNITSDDSGVEMTVGDPDRLNDRTDACRGCRAEYQFEISVPADTIVDVGTVTDGRIEVKGIRGLVNASNVNGPVSARDLATCARIASVNGSLDVSFTRPPGGDCTIETLNGRITVGLPAGSNLDAILNIGHGDIESDFDVEPIALPVKHERQERDDRLGFRIEQPAGVRLGAGGPTFTLASLNGDVHIVKNK